MYTSITTPSSRMRMASTFCIIRRESTGQPKLPTVANGYIG